MGTGVTRVSIGGGDTKAMHSRRDAVYEVESGAVSDVETPVESIPVRRALLFGL